MEFLKLGNAKISPENIVLQKGSEMRALDAVRCARWMQ
jgi:hypothetical protein